jgi:carboxyl-terminal processing protease
VGGGGVGDRHVDLFWGSWTLNFNLKTDKYCQRFLDAYGREHFEPEMLRTIAAIEDLRGQGVKGIIFDLRYNPGGRKTELVEILDHVLPEGPLFRSYSYNGTEAVDSSDGASVVEMPMVVMVNQDSYSAAEFFAAAMQEYGWATIVGTQTVGKGNYQQTIPLSDGSAVAISTGHYSTPNGVNLEGVGITPDVVVEVDQETYTKIYLGNLTGDEDPQLKAALEVFAK